jgi:cell division ATPase FtsA
VILHDVKPAIDDYKIKPSVVITGGTSRIAGIETLASQTMKMPVRIGRNPDWVIADLQKPELSTVIGLIQFAFSDVSGDLPEQPRQKSFFSRFTGLMR